MAVTPDPDIADTHAWRAGVLASMLRIVLMLGTITAIPSIVLSLDTGLLAVALLDLIAVTGSPSSPCVRTSRTDGVPAASSASATSWGSRSW